jgi:hypothetical protein
MLLIDRPIFVKHGRRFAHLISDTSLAELHEGAARLGLSRAYHGDHYDVPEEWVPRCLDAGVVQVDPREIVRRLRAAGLRIKRRQP